jgi:hypothetical protein
MDLRRRFFRARVMPRCKYYDKIGKGDLIDDNVSPQNIEIGVVSFTGLFN